MKRVYLFAVAGLFTLMGLGYWLNGLRYPNKSVNWRVGKSALDVLLVATVALYLPALLIAWVVMWLTRPFKSKGLQVTSSVIFGIIFGSISGVALEVICVAGIFAVDLLTGDQGIYGWWSKGPPPSFMSYLEPRASVATE